MMFITTKPFNCMYGHKAEVVICDLSKSYNTDKPHYMVRCKGTKSNECCFTDFFVNKHDAVHSWNLHHMEKTK